MMIGIMDLVYRNLVLWLVIAGNVVGFEYISLTNDILLAPHMRSVTTKRGTHLEYVGGPRMRHRKFRHYSGELDKSSLVKTKYHMYIGQGEPLCLEYLIYDVNWFQSNDVTRECHNSLRSIGCHLVWHSENNYTVGFMENKHTVYCFGIRGKPHFIPTNKDPNWTVLYRLRNIKNFHTGTSWLVAEHQGYQVVSPMIIPAGVLYNAERAIFTGVTLLSNASFYYPTKHFIVGRGLTLREAVSSPSVRLPHGNEVFEDIPTCTNNQDMLSDLPTIKYCPCMTLLGPISNGVSLVGCSPEYERLNGPCRCVVNNEDLAESILIVVDNEHHGVLWHIIDVISTAIQFIMGYSFKNIPLNAYVKLVMWGFIYKISIQVLVNPVLSAAITTLLLLWL